MSLLTDLYLTRARDPLPVIVMRTPYGRRAPYGTIARLFAERSYHAVIQSTFGSGGHIDYDRGAADGRAAAEGALLPGRRVIPGPAGLGIRDREPRKAAGVRADAAARPAGTGVGLRSSAPARRRHGGRRAPGRLLPRAGAA